MNINDFKNNLKQGGVRPNLFRVNGAIGPEGTDTATSFLVRTAALPASNLSTILVPFRGRQLKLPGNRSFDDWTLTIISDSEFNLRTKFERWLEAINSTVGNVAEQPHDLTQGSFLAGGLFPTWSVDQLDRQNNPIKTYSFFHCFPTAIGDMALDSDASDTLSEFTVTMSYSYFLTSDSPDANLIESVDLGGVGEVG
tara:strand:+ start:102 stop:692 length:591 start_codon:yes stop_codon:yes gene_type:complete